MAIRPVVALDTGAFCISEDGEDLAEAAVETCLLDLADEDGVSLAEDGGLFRSDFAEDAHRQARTREGISPHDVIGEAEGGADGACLVLEEVAKRLHEAEGQIGGQSTDVVVGLDLGGGLAFRRCTLDDIRIEGALGEEIEGAALGGEGAGFAFESADEAFADHATLLFRIGYSGEMGKEVVGGIDGHKADAEMFAETGDDVARFILAKEAIVDEDASQLVTDGSMEKGSGYGTVHPTGDTGKDAGGSDLFTDGVDSLINEGSGCPCGGTSGDVEAEVAQEVEALRGMGNLGMELQGHDGCVPGSRNGCHGRDRAGGSEGNGMETIGQRGHLVSMAHPDIGLVGKGPEQRMPSVGEGDWCMTEFAPFDGTHLSPQVLGEELHAVTNAENGDTQVEHDVLEAWRVGVIDAVRTTRQDEPTGIEGADAIGGRIPREEFGIDAALADATHDEASVLGPIIQDDDGVTMRMGGHGSDAIGGVLIWVHTRLYGG